MHYFQFLLIFKINQTCPVSFPYPHSKKSKKIPPKKFGSTFLTLFLQTGCQLFHFINNQFVSLSSFRLVYLKHAKSLRIF